MDNGPIFEWNPGELIVDVDDDPEAMHEEMDQVEYPDNNDYDEQDPDMGGIPIAPRPTIITDDEDVDELEEDRSNDADKYEGDWTIKLDHEDEEEDEEEDPEEDPEEEYESRSDPEGSEHGVEVNVEENNVQVNVESSEDEDSVENSTITESEHVVQNRGNNTRP